MRVSRQIQLDETPRTRLRGRTGARLIALGAALAVLGPGGVAEAQIYREAEGAEWVLHLDLVSSYLRALPSMSLGGSGDLGPRVQLGSLPSAGSGVFVGAAAGFGAVFADRWLLPLLDVELSTMVGRRPRIITSVEGSIASLEPWTAGQLSVFAFGFGKRWKHRRWMLAASVQPGVGVIFMSAQIATGKDLADVTPAAASFALRGTVELCRRLDPDNRACLYAAPNLYDFGFLNGATFGLRWELGP